MKTPISLLTSSGRAGAGASPGLIPGAAETGSAGFLINVTALDPGAVLTVTAEADGAARAKCVIDRPNAARPYIIACGPGLGVSHADATYAADPNGTPPAKPGAYRVTWNVTGGNATFGVDAVTA